MFNSTRVIAKSMVIDVKRNNIELSSLSSQCLPECSSLAQLAEELAAEGSSVSEDVDFENLIILNGYLINPDRLSRENKEEDAVRSLLHWISKVILPNSKIVAQDEAPEDSSAASRERILHVTRQRATLGLRCLNALINKISPSPLETLEYGVLLSLIAFASSQDQWTTATSVEISTSLLSKYKHQILTQDFIITYIIQSFIRPLFSPSKPDTITSAGRAAMPSSAPPKKIGAEDLERSSKPWKYIQIYSVTVFRWAIDNVPADILPQTWHNFTPPLLTLLDDPSTRIRIAGSSALSSFLPHLSPTLLSQSGLGQLFEDALLPTLLYLPNLTPLEESLLLLPATYTTLFILNDARFPLSTQELSTTTTLTTANPLSKSLQNKTQRLKSLDLILRKGILLGYLHSMEHFPILTILLSNLNTIIQKMGIHTTKHLKDIIPILSAILTDPFSPSRPDLLLQAILTLQTLLLNTWPRTIGMEKWRVEVLKSLSLGWQGVCSEDGLEEVKKEMKVAGKMFLKASEMIGKEEGQSAKEAVEMLVESIPELRDLFDS